MYQHVRYGKIEKDRVGNTKVGEHFHKFRKNVKMWGFCQNRPYLAKLWNVQLAFLVDDSAMIAPSSIIVWSISKLSAYKNIRKILWKFQKNAGSAYFLNRPYLAQLWNAQLAFLADDSALIAPPSIGIWPISNQSPPIANWSKKSIFNFFRINLKIHIWRRNGPSAMWFGSTVVRYQGCDCVKGQPNWSTPVEVMMVRPTPPQFRGAHFWPSPKKYLLGKRPYLGSPGEMGSGMGTDEYHLNRATIC